MNEQQLALRIKTVLDAGLRMTPEVAARLKVAREHALARYRIAESAYALAVAGHGGSGQTRDPQGSWAQIALSIAFLIAALVGVHYWQEAREAAFAAAQFTEELVDVDTRVLTDDLPIKAYLDEDFQSWLKQSSE
jgi:hypothetical protein